MSANPIIGRRGVPTRIVVMVTIVLSSAGCGTPAAGPVPVETAGVYAQLATACRPLRSSTPPPLTGTKGAVAARQTVRETLAAAEALEACGKPLETLAPVDESRAVAPAAMITGALGRLAGRAPEPLLLRYDPGSNDLRRGDATRLAAAVARGLAREDVRLEISVGRGGLGNAFEQTVRAENRAHRIKEMLPPGVVSSITFDPGLPDDAVRLEFVPVSE